MMRSLTGSWLSHPCTYLKSLRNRTTLIEMLYNIGWIVWFHKLFRSCTAPITLHLRHTVCISLQEISDLYLLLLLFRFLLSQVIETHIARWATMLHHVNSASHFKLGWKSSCEFHLEFLSIVMISSRTLIKHDLFFNIKRSKNDTNISLFNLIYSSNLRDF